MEAAEECDENLHMSYLIRSWMKPTPHRRHCMVHQAQRNPPCFKGLPPFCFYRPQADVSFIIYSLLCVSLPFLMLLQYFGSKVSRRKRFSPTNAVYFSIPALRKFHPVTVWLEYEGVVQSEMRNRMKMNERCSVVGRKCGSWEGLQNPDGNSGGLRTKMKIQEFISISPVLS